ncbi:hypothetical protein V6N12_068056 [Hibiscus sabdariffa]|uniref:Uncharacterized protein n=1 Tax=Hibiscus sabdariffa TaxID=183260 RepID=A0ABR2FNW3_9ROSI
MVYLAPLKKSTEGFESLPYVVALVSAVLWIYYATLKSEAYLLMTINSIGCVVETVYIIVFVVYAPKKARFNNKNIIKEGERKQPSAIANANSAVCTKSSNTDSVPSLHVSGDIEVCRGENPYGPQLENGNK